MTFPTSTTNPTPSQALKSALPAINAAAPSMRNSKRRAVPISIGPFAAAAGAGNLLTGLDLKAYAPAGGKLLSARAYFTVAGTGAGASTTLTFRLDTVVATGGSMNLLLASAGLGVITNASAFTAGNTFDATGGILDLVYAVGTVFTAGSFVVVLELELNDDRSIEAGTIGENVVVHGGRLDALMVRVANTGTVTPMVVRAKLNGSPVGTPVTFANSLTNKVMVIDTAQTAVVPGDLIELEVVTPPTGGSGLSWGPVINQLFGT